MHRLPSPDKYCHRGRGPRPPKIQRSAPDYLDPPHGSPGNTSLILQFASRDKCRRHHGHSDQRRVRRRRSHRNRHGRCPPEKPVTSRNVRGCSRRLWITINFIVAVQRTCTRCRTRLIRVRVINELEINGNVRVVSVDFMEIFSLQSTNSMFKCNVQLPLPLKVLAKFRYLMSNLRNFSAPSPW